MQKQELVERFKKAIEREPETVFEKQEAEAYRLGDNPVYVIVSNILDFKMSEHIDSQFIDHLLGMVADDMQMWFEDYAIEYFFAQMDNPGGLSLAHECVLRRYSEVRGHLYLTAITPNLGTGTANFTGEGIRGYYYRRLNNGSI